MTRWENGESDPRESISVRIAILRRALDGEDAGDPTEAALTAGPAGELVLDLGPRGRALRIEPWSAGLAVWERSGGRWMQARRDPNFPVLNLAAMPSMRESAAPLLESIPEDVRRIAQRFWTWQVPMLQFIARDARARDLLHSNAPLLWMLTGAIINGRAQPDLLGRRQADILEALGLPSGEPGVRLLKGCPAGIYQRRTADLLESVLKRPALVTRLRRLPHVSLPIMAVLAALPELLEMRVPEHLDPQASAQSLMAEGQEIIRQRNDALRVANELRLEDPHTTLNRVRGLAEMRTLHDRWTARFNLIRSELEDARDATVVFPEPPIPGNEHIVPIRNRAELRAEGRSMQHCVGSLANRILEGRMHVYRVMAPERLTLAIARSGSRYVVDECKGACNSTPGSESMIAIAKWLEQGNARLIETRKQGPRRAG